MNRKHIMRSPKETMSDRYTFYQACETGDYDTAELFLKDGFDPNVKNINGDPLCIASLRGHTKIVKLLLSYGKRILTKDESLYNASFNGHVDIVNILIDHGAAFNVADSKGMLPIHFAALEGHIKVVEILIQLWIKYSFDFNIDIGNRDMETPLSLASYRGHNDVIKLLIYYGADIELTNYCGDRPLDSAIFGGNPDTVKLLLNLGANPNRKNYMGFTSLHNARNEHKPYTITELLLAHGAENVINHPEYRKVLPLFISCQRNIRIKKYSHTNLPQEMMAMCPELVRK